MLRKSPHVEYGSVAETKVASSAAIFKILHQEELMNKVVSFLSDKDYLALRRTNRQLYGPIKIPDYPRQYALHGYKFVKSICFIGECFYCEPVLQGEECGECLTNCLAGGGWRPIGQEPCKPIPYYILTSCDFQYPSYENQFKSLSYSPTLRMKLLNSNNIFKLDKKTSEKIKTVGNIVSCFTFDTLRCVCCVSKYSLGTLACGIGFFAGMVKQSCCPGIRNSESSLLLDPEEARDFDGKPTHQVMQ